MIDEKYTARHEEFYGDEKPSPAIHLAVWIALISTCLAVWGAVIALIVHLL